MPRIRTIKPEFWSSLQVGDCSTTSRLLFLGLISHADDHGVIPMEPRRFKALIFPYDELSLDCLVVCIQQLIDTGLVIVFDHAKDGATYMQITGFAKHQRIEKPTFRYPEFDDQLDTIRRLVVDPSTPEGNGKECNRNITPPLPPPVGAVGQNAGSKKRSAKEYALGMAWPPEVNTSDFREAWAAWVEHRTSRSPKPTETAFEKQRAWLIKIGLARSLLALEISTRNAWQGLHEPGAKDAPKPPQRKAGL